MKKLSIYVLIAVTALLLIGAASTTRSFFRIISLLGQNGDPGAPINGDVWYDSTGNLLRARVNGASVSLGAGGSDNWTASGATNSYLLGNAGIGTTPFTAQRLTLEVDGLTTLPINGVFLTNGTPTTVGVQSQYSPALYFGGGAWLTVSASNAPVIFRQYMQPVTGSSIPDTYLVWQRSLNGGAFVSAMSLSGAGALTAASDVSSGGNVYGTLFQAASTGTIGWNGKSTLASSANGAIETLNAAGNARSSVQANIPQVTKTANYPVTVTDSGLRFVNIGAAATNTLTLPTAAAGLHYWGYVDAAFNMQFQAVGSDKIQDGPTLGAAAGDVHSSTVGSTIHFFSPKSLLWIVDQKSGTWVLD